jgi:tripartite-type tricarboxylate transporter receptor subunit TctC
MRTGWCYGLLAGLLTLSVTPGFGAPAGNYPDKAVEILADSAAGSTPDVALRFVAEELGKLWGRQVLVVNRPGAGGSLAARSASQAAPDGYTLYQPVLSTFVALHPAASNIPLQVPRDFSPIGFVAENPMFIAASPKLGVRTFPELIALAKERPGKVSYATTGVGRLTHLTGELLQREAQIKLQVVPYVGGPAQAISDVTTGRVDLIIEGYSGIAGAARSGTINLLAVASANRLADFLDLPTVAETIPDFIAIGWGVLVAPLRSPDVIIQKVSADLQQVASLPDLQKKLAELGSYARAMTPAETTAFVQKQQSLWAPVLVDIARQEEQK